MKRLGLIYYFTDDLSFSDKLDRVGGSFSPEISVQGIPAEYYQGLKQPVLFIVDATDPEQVHFLARLDPYDSEANIRQALVYAIAGKFNNLSEEKSKQIWRGGDPSTSGIFEADGFDLPLPQVSGKEILDRVISALNLQWVPWYAWAGLGAFLVLQGLQSRGFLFKAIYGGAGAYLTYKAISKYRKK